MIPSDRFACQPIGIVVLCPHRQDLYINFKKIFHLYGVLLVFRWRVGQREPTAQVEKLSPGFQATCPTMAGNCTCENFFLILKL